MQTIAHQIYPDRFRQVETIVNAIADRNLEQANRLLAEHLESLPQIAGEPERLQVELFLKALSARLDPAVTISNLYLMPDQGQQIRMFNFMAEKFPVVRRAQDIVNAAHLNAVREEEQFTLMDIGIGTGQQAATLIARLVEANAPVKRVDIIGIEPSAESLDVARERFQAVAAEGGPEIVFAELHKTAEQLTEEDWTFIGRTVRQAGGKLLLNASFALHHVQPVDIRTDFFRRLNALRPERFMIIEPYGDYTTDSLLERFHNAWHHYGLTFRAIDIIDASDREKSEVKRVFFGREMPDVLAADNRVEQYETAEMWLNRLSNAGFEPFSIPLPAFGDFNPLVEITANPGYVGFNINRYPIVAVIGVS